MWAKENTAAHQAVVYQLSSGGETLAAAAPPKDTQELLKHGSSWTYRWRPALLRFLGDTRTERAVRYVAPLPIITWLSYKRHPQTQFTALGVILYCIMSSLLPPMLGMVMVLLFAGLPAVCLALANTTLLWTIWAQVPESGWPAAVANGVAILVAFFMFLLASNLRLGPLAPLMLICYYSVVYTTQYAAIQTKTPVMEGVQGSLGPYKLSDFVPAWILSQVPAAVIGLIETLPLNLNGTLPSSVYDAIKNIPGLHNLKNVPINLAGSLSKGISLKLPGGYHMIRIFWETRHELGLIWGAVVFSFIALGFFALSLLIPPMRSATTLYKNALGSCHAVIAANLIDWRITGKGRVTGDPSGGGGFAETGYSNAASSGLEDGTVTRRESTGVNIKRISVLLNPDYVDAEMLDDEEISQLFARKRAFGIHQEIDTATYNELPAERPALRVQRQNTIFVQQENPYAGYSVTRHTPALKAFNVSESGLSIIQRYPLYRTRLNLLLQATLNMSSTFLISAFETIAFANHGSNMLPEKWAMKRALERLGANLYALQCCCTYLYVTWPGFFATLVGTSIEGNDEIPFNVTCSEPDDFFIGSGSMVKSVDGPPDSQTSRRSSRSRGGRMATLPMDLSSIPMELASASVELVGASEQLVRQPLATQSVIEDKRHALSFATYRPNVAERATLRNVGKLLLAKPRNVSSVIDPPVLPELNQFGQWFDYVIVSVYEALRVCELCSQAGSRYGINHLGTEAEALKVLMQQAQDLVDRFEGNSACDGLRLLICYVHDHIMQTTLDLLQIHQTGYINSRTPTWRRFLSTAGTVLMGLPLFVYCLISPWVRAVRRWFKKSSVKNLRNPWRENISKTTEINGQLFQHLTKTESSTLQLQVGPDVKDNFESGDNVWTLKLTSAHTCGSKVLRNSGFWFALRLAVGNTLIFALGTVVQRWRTLNITHRHREGAISKFIDLERLMTTKYAGWSCIGFLTTITETTRGTTKRAVLRAAGVVLGTLSALLCLMISRDNVAVHACWYVVTCFVAVWVGAHPGNPAVGFDPSWGYVAQLFAYQQVIIMSLAAIEEFDKYEIVVERLLAQLLGIGVALAVSWTLVPTFCRRHIRQNCIAALEHLQSNLEAIMELSMMAADTESESWNRYEAYTHEQAQKATQNARRFIADNELLYSFWKLDHTFYELVSSLERRMALRNSWREQNERAAPPDDSPEQLSLRLSWQKAMVEIITDLRCTTSLICSALQHSIPTLDQRTFLICYEEMSKKVLRNYNLIVKIADQKRISPVFLLGDILELDHMARVLTHDLRA